jgi:hypothetical protein
VPRALTTQRSVVTAGERDGFLVRLETRREHYRNAGCRYWIFEEVDLPGAFIEFIEASDVETLRAALAAAPDRFLGQLRVYREVEPR